MNLPIGNTKVVATMIQEVTEGDVFRIDTVKPYPEDYCQMHPNIKLIRIGSA
jgi:flavodoxin